MLTRTLHGGALAGIIALALIVPAAASTDGEETAARSAVLDRIDASLRGAGLGSIGLEKAELFLNAEGAKGPQTLVVANNRTHRLDSQFVERDPRRGGFADISYLVDQSDGVALAFANPTGTAVVALPNAVTEARLDASMLRWQNSPLCPGPGVVKLPDPGTDPDVVDGLVFEDPARIGTPSADITHAGWLPAAFFDALAPQGSRSILGVTFTFIFTDDDDNPTDVDHNGRADVAFREIYYNAAFGWSEGPSRPRGIDIDSVATHESGHAFGLGHFGKVFIDTKDVIKFAPRAVMNAVYVSRFTELAGSDNASFCSIWANRK